MAPRPPSGSATGGLDKKGGGIVGITKTTSALNRWALSYNLRSHLALETRKRIDSKEDALLSVLQRFGLFSDEAPQTLQNIANKDL